MTSRLPKLSPSLLALNARSLAACPLAEREALGAVLDARSTHRARGRTAQRRGEAFEGVVRAALLSHPAVRYLGHVEPRAKPTHDGGLRYIGQGACDWYGVLSDGRGYVVECKRGERIYRDRALAPSHAAAVAPHQAAQLDAYADAGAVALLAYDLGAGLRWVRWRDARWPCGVLEDTGVPTLGGVL